MIDVKHRSYNTLLTGWISVLLTIAIGCALIVSINRRNDYASNPIRVKPPAVSVDGPFLIIERSAILASQIVFVDRYGRVFTVRGGSNGFDTNLSQEEVLALWKEALANERQTVDQP